MTALPTSQGAPKQRGWSIPVAASVSTLLVLVAYVWIISLGTWTAWPQAYDYSHYDKLATAFLHGHLFLDQRPDPGLVALPNPYDPAARGDLAYLTDASLYQGRYFLYFGPVPALLLCPIKLFIPETIHDIYLVFAYMAALFLMQTAFVLRMRGRYFPGVPAWIVSACILFLGLSTPYTWMLGSQAAPHNAAIAAGQFFLLAGIYCGFEALATPSFSRGRGAAAGALLSLAAGSRLTMAVPAAFVGLLLLLWLLRRYGRPIPWRTYAGDATAFAAPLVLGALALGWYNWARFGSVLETGFSYQLAMLPIEQYRNDLFSVRYVVQNLYNYFLNPPKLRFAFPYVWPQIGARVPLIAAWNLSPIYFTEENSGLLYVTPLILFSLAPALRIAARSPLVEGEAQERGLLHWLEWALAGSFLVSAAVFLVFFWTSNRYLLDFAPPLLLLSVLGFWEVSEALARQHAARGLVITLGIVLIVFSLLISAVLVLAQNAGAYTNLDPHIGRELRRLFGP